MRDMRVLTVREIRDIIALLDQDDQHLIDLLAALTGEKARDVRTWLNTGGDEALLSGEKKRSRPRARSPVLCAISPDPTARGGDWRSR